MKQNRLLALLFTSAVTCAPIATAHAHKCYADLNGDDLVNGFDRAIVLAAWGTANEIADINDDGTVDGLDLTYITSGWGVCHCTTWAEVLEWDVNAAIVTDPALRSAIAATGWPWRVRDCGTGIEMLLIPPGSFTMGCSPSLPPDGWCSDNENPLHTVTISAFYLGRYEVTQAQWTAIMTVNPSFFQGYSDSPTRAVEELFPESIADFNDRTGLRLPTEAEWEYAYRAQLGTEPSVTRWAFHNDTDDEAVVGNIAWFSGNNGEPGTSTWGTKVVGGKTANALGLHDMSGNVMEYVNDWTGQYPSDPATNPIGPSEGPYKEVRGGSWFLGSDRCRASKRWEYVYSNLVGNYGCRSARNP